MTKTDQLCERLCAKSREDFYDVYNRFEWTERIDPDHVAMPLEITTLYGTDVWGSLTDEQKHRLAVCEVGNLFSGTLHGEQLLVAGLSNQLYGKKLSPEITDYLHHFLDEENKHMIMFGLYCRKYVGRVYPAKSLPLPKVIDTPGEEIIGFYSLAMVVEDFGDYFNIRTMKDTNCDPLVREISKVHHIDESRHLSFDRAYLADLCEEWLPQWDDAQRAKFSGWLRGFMTAHWGTYYNPSVYKDAGIEQPYEVRRQAIAHPAQQALYAKVSEKLDRFFSKIGLLLDVPTA